MWRAIKHAIVPPKEMIRTAVTQFYYPRQGFGMIADALARDIKVLGGEIHTRTALHKLVPGETGAKVTVKHADGSLSTIDADQVVSTIPLNFLLASIPEELGSAEVLSKYQLEYRDVICLFLALKRDKVSNDSWTYFPEKKLIFGRTHEPKNWSPEMVPGPEFTSLVVEIFSTRGEPVWEMTDQEIVSRVVEQMHEIGWIRRTDLHKSWVQRIPFAYPVYRVGYEEKLQQVRDYLGQWSGLHLVGRTGSFRYMNSDGVVEDVFRFMSELFPEQAPDVNGLLAQEGRWM
jgi:protoporphyrinogen oxidase